MRTVWILATVLLMGAVALGQPSGGSSSLVPGKPSISALVGANDPAAVKCSKTITFAIAEGGQPVPAIPKFAAKWIGKTKHVEGYPQLCLSQIPSSSTYNYVVIFSVDESSFYGLTPSAHTYTSTGPLSGNIAGLSGYGGTWNYAYTSALPATTTSSIALQRIDASKEKLGLRAYDQEGRQISNYSVNRDHAREKQLEQAIVDIYHDSPEIRPHKSIAAPLSVYYVNCDVDSPTPVSPVTSAEAPVKPAPPKPAALPHATVEFLSNSAGADIYLDGNYIGKTPFTVAVASGEHVVLMHKRDFSTWQQKLRAGAGPLRVTGYLERRVLVLP